MGWLAGVGGHDHPERERELRNCDALPTLSPRTVALAAIVNPRFAKLVYIIGIGTASNRKGMRRGNVNNIDATVASIQAAVDEAENMAGCEISQVYAALSGPAVRGLNSPGVVAIKDKEVRDAMRTNGTAR